MVKRKTPLLVPGLSCGSMHADPPSGVLVDGRDVYKAVYDACAQAERTILITGWQFDNHVELLRGADAEGALHPTGFFDMLGDLCERRPALEVYILAWHANPVFALERIPFQHTRLRLHGHRRIHYRTDRNHPTTASQHQKYVVVDRGIAMLGGMDVCNSRWDRRDHAVADDDRRNRWRSYKPYHDVNAYVTGDAVDVLRAWFCDRWKGATGEALELPEVSRTAITIEPSLEIRAPRVGLARTDPAWGDPPRAPVSELHELHLRAIASAERVIYVENQYVSSNEIGRAIERRMARRGEPLEIVLVLPQGNAGMKERISMGAPQAEILRRLTRAAARYGHRLGVYYPAARDGDRDVPVFIHSKVLGVDDRFLLVSSANFTNRSMGFDTELGIAWEAPEAFPSIRDARIDLLAEHCGLVRPEADALLAPITGLVARLDELACARTHRLRIHARNVDEARGWLLSRLLPDPTPFDPRDPQSFQATLPAPIELIVRAFNALRQRLRRKKRRRAGAPRPPGDGPTRASRAPLATRRPARP